MVIPPRCFSFLLFDLKENGRLLFPRSGKGKVDYDKPGAADCFGINQIVFRHLQLDGGTGKQLHRIIDVCPAETGSDKNGERIGPGGERDHP